MYMYTHICIHTRIPTHTLHYITLHCIALDYAMLHYRTLHYTTLHYIALHYIALHCIALHCIHTYINRGTIDIDTLVRHEGSGSKGS